MSPPITLPDKEKLIDSLCGEINIADILLNDIPCKSLIDTGSTVSTISKSFYESLNVPLNPIGDLLHIEAATGHTLPYTGYVECDLKIVQLNITDTSGLFLVVPDTFFNKTVPVIVGTNLLRLLTPNHSLSIQNPWRMAFQCLAMYDRQLTRCDGRLAIIKAAVSKKTLVKSNHSLTVRAILDKKISMQNCLAMAQFSTESKFDDGIEITPILVDYDSSDLLDITVSNHTSRPIVISPRSIIGELQWCSIETAVSKLPPQQCSSIANVTNDQSVSDLLSGFELKDIEANAEQVKQLKLLLMSNSSAFSLDDQDLGFTKLVQHRIELTDEIPFRQRHRRIPPSVYQELRSHLQSLLDQNIISKSHSPWCSNVVLARKKDKSLRLCIDYRQLNNRTIKDAYALPRLEETLDCLAGSKYFTVLDMRSGYHQVEVADEHKCRTAFSVGSLGLYEYNRMPFGLSNAPATYQRLMEDCFRPLINKECVIFLDDILVFSDTFEEHLNRLQHVFQCIKDGGMKLSPKKCHFCRPKVKYLGHIVSAQGVETDPDKVEKVKNWPIPTNVDETRRFIGFASYYRKFVQNFATIAKPLTDLLSGIINKKKHWSRQRTKTTIPWRWTTEQQNAFDSLKLSLTSPPILGYANYGLPFELHTDASGTGLGAVLYQEQDGVKRVISYASRSLKISERNYPAHKLEFLAVKWAVCEKFYEYLYGSKLVIFTDNNPLTYITTSAKLDATGHRWLAALSLFDFSIKYKPGKNNGDADALSRYNEITENSVKAVCKYQTMPCLTPICMSVILLPSEDDEMDPVASSRLWRTRQRQDQTLSIFLNCVSSRTKPKVESLDFEGKILLKEFKKLKVTRGVLYRQVKVQDIDQYQLVLPFQYRHTAIESAHNDMGHPGKDRTLSILRDRVYWPKMSRDIDSWIDKCDRCIKSKSPTNNRAPLVSIVTTEPLELLCMDYMSLEMSKGGFQNILVLTDHFTKYALAIPTKDQTAKTTAKMIFNEFVVHYGIPRKFHSDQGTCFESDLMKELCSLAGIFKSRTSLFRPSGNGLCERMNKTVLSMLSTLSPEQKTDWKTHLGSLAHSYNCTRHESTKVTPFELMFGRKPRLALDVTLGLVSDTETKEYGEYVKDLKSSLKQAYKICQDNSNRARLNQKKQYDKKIKGATVEVGDRILVKILAFTGKHKISDKWESVPYIVLKKPNSDIPVFDVQREDGVGRVRTLHRNHLLPIGELPLEIPEDRNQDSGEEQDIVVMVTTTETQDSPVSDLGPVDGDKSEAESIVESDDHSASSIPFQGHEVTKQLSKPIPTPRTSIRPTPQPRRSTRVRKQPEWMRSGNYVQSQTPIDHGSNDNILQMLAQGTLDPSSASKLLVISKIFC